MQIPLIPHSRKNERTDSIEKRRDTYTGPGESRRFHRPAKLVASLATTEP
jgi:hypothetical protein